MVHVVKLILSEKMSAHVQNLEQKSWGKKGQPAE